MKKLIVLILGGVLMGVSSFAQTRIQTSHDVSNNLGQTVIGGYRLLYMTSIPHLGLDLQGTCGNSEDAGRPCACAPSANLARHWGTKSNTQVSGLPAVPVDTVYTTACYNLKKKNDVDFADLEIVKLSENSYQFLARVDRYYMKHFYSNIPDVARQLLIETSSQCSTSGLTVTCDITGGGQIAFQYL